MCDSELFALAQCYYEVGRIGDAGQLARGLVDRLKDAQALRMAVQLLTEARIDADAEKALNKYLKLSPNDADAWADLAKLQQRTGRRQAAQQSFIQAYRIDKNGIFGRLQKDQELYEIAKPLFQPR